MIALAVGAKRYDGGSGAAIFTGVIPLKPGQLFEADLANVSLWDGTQEIGATPEALWPQHSDGSAKVIRVAATLTLASGAQKALTLRLGQPRTVAGPALPPIDGIWMRNPRLIGCTDAAHLCASRIAPLPLVPIPNPNLPTQWNAFLTTEWDDPTTTFPSWGRVRNEVMNDLPPAHGGTANYNFLQAMYCKYLTSGELDRLWEAHHLAQYAGGFPTDIKGNTYGAPEASRAGDQDKQSYVVFYGEPYQGHAVGDLFPTLTEPWTGLPVQPFATTEWYSGIYEDLYLCYCLSDWSQARGTFLQWGLAGFGGGPTTVFPGPPVPTYNYGGRFDWRLFRGSDYLYGLLSPPMALYFHFRYGQKRTVPSPRTHRADFVNWLVANHFDIYDNYKAGPGSPQYAPTHWASGSWWGWPGTYPVTGGIEGLPLFQLSTLLYNVASIYQNFTQDARVPTFITKSTQFLKELTSPWNIPGIGAGDRIPYADASTNWTTAAGHAPSGSVDPWGVTILKEFFVLAWQLTGNPAYRDIADRAASNKHMCLSGGTRAGSAGFKELGECYSHAFYGAAWRAGVPFGAWEIDGAVPVPEPEPPPIPEPVPESVHVMLTAAPEVVGGADRTMRLTAVVSAPVLDVTFGIAAGPNAPNGEIRMTPVLVMPTRPGEYDFAWNLDPIWTPAGDYALFAEARTAAGMIRATAAVRVLATAPPPEPPAPSDPLLARVEALETQAGAGIVMDRDLLARISQLEGVAASLVSGQGDLVARVIALEAVRTKVKEAL